jgi:SAM-dependent methyltransferase
MTVEDHRLSFGAAAEHYDRSRPTYPIAALTWTFAPIAGARLRIVDLGAGTGLLTRVALTTGHEIIPVEPDPGMRDQLAAATPGTVPLAGSAEEIPLPDGSVDAVIAGTAYHWFDPDQAHPEIARVLRPGGVIAALWNDRDTTLGWTSALNEILGRMRVELHQRRLLDQTLSFGPLFTGATLERFEHHVRQTPQGLADLIASRSYYLTATPQRQAEMLAEVRNLCETHPDLAGRDSFELPYNTTVYRATKL